MQVILRQTFPLGRFHATPWRASPFDDPHGEWPPSPFRLVRALVARFHQLARERGTSAAELEGVVRALATSEIRYHLPPGAWRGPVIRQYQPGTVLEWDPAGKKDQARGAMKVPSRGLAQDNSYAIAPDEPVFWFLDGPEWDEARLALLDACLARMTYFGRAESITAIHREPCAPRGIEVNCELLDRRARGAVPVLCVTPAMTAALACDEAALRTTTVPPGAAWRYAVRPRRPAPGRVAVPVRYKSTNLLQFAIGATVDPPAAAIATLTGWLRGGVVRHALTQLNHGVGVPWRDAPPDLRAQMADLAGKSVDGTPLQGHAHTRYLVWVDDERLTRLLVHRPHPFEPWEHEAILRAAEAPLGWSPAAGRGGWTVHLVPLDSAVPPPPGFDAAPAQAWQSVTPYVPSRHFIDSRGRAKKGETVPDQIAEELARRGYPPVEVGPPEDAGWVRVHAPKRQAEGGTNNARRAFRLRLTFAEPVLGPLFLGHSSFFGLGLFRPSA